MPDTALSDIALLTARRAYEFLPDVLRLSAICTKPVEERINSLFHFRAAIFGSPAPTFGDVPATYPPGFVFDMGFWVSPQADLVPIRFIHFEQRRIVIDVAGKSDAIDSIYALLRSTLHDITAPDGSPLIGEPEQIHDYSEITAHCEFPMDAFAVPEVRRIVTKAASRREQRGTKMTLVPTLSFRPVLNDAEFPGASTITDAFAFTFTLRAGTRPGDRICFSNAPLDSDAHLAYLRALAETLSAHPAP